MDGPVLFDYKEQTISLARSNRLSLATVVVVTLNPIERQITANYKTNLCLRLILGHFICFVCFILYIVGLYKLSINHRK